MAGFVARMLTRLERRYGAGWSSGGGWSLGDRGGFLSRGGPVSTADAEGLSAVLACVELIAGALASLPASLVVDDGAGGRMPAPPTAPALRLLTRPNRFQSWPTLVSWMASQILLQGNSVLRIDADGRGAVQGLTPVPWQWLNPCMIAGSGGPRLCYDIVQSNAEAKLLGLAGRLLDTDVMHVRARSDFGIVGRSVLSRAAGPVREALAISDLAARNWSAGLRPSGIVTAPTYLNDKQRPQALERVAELQAAVATGKVPLLEGAWTWTQTGLSSVDSELLSSRAFSVAEICRLFLVPEQLLQSGARVVPDLAPFTSALAIHALQPLVRTITSEFDASVLPAGMHLVLDLDGLARGNFASVVAALAALKQSAIITANDARDELGWAARPDGDVLGASPAPNWPADATGLPALHPSPGPTGSGVPAPGNHGNAGAAGMMNGTGGHA